MPDWLIVAEKNSQAKNIAAGLFDKKKGSGSFQNGGFGGQDVSSVLSGDVRITHFVGHIYEMKMPNEQDDKYNIKSDERTNSLGMVIGGGYKSKEEMMENYPIELDLNHIQWKLSQVKHRKISNNLKKLYNNAKNIVVATDFDNEGEMIYMNWQKNNIKNPDWHKLYRLKINDMTPVAVQKAFKNLIAYSSNDQTLNMMQSQGFARSIADYEYGLSFSYYGRQLASQMGSAKGQYGRLKNSLLGVVYNQEKEHDNFVEKSHYRIDMVLPNGETLQGDETLVYDKKEDAENYIKKGELPSRATINYEEKTVSENPKKLYSRNELIIAMTKKHSKLLSKNESWNTPLQSLYEKHVLLSYPRTDIQYIGKNTYKELSNVLQTPKVQSLIEERVKHVEQKSGMQCDIKIDPQTPPKKAYVDDSKLNGESHYALVPTENEPIHFDALTQAEQAMYIEDLMHTMAIFCNPALVIKRSYTSGNHFKANQSRFKQYGYRFITDQVTENKDQFPDSGVYDVTYKATEVKAKRPPLFTETSLLAMMKKVNWGTSATRDATVHDMIKKGSFKKSKGKLRVNPELKSTVQILLDHKLIDFKMTSNWQSKLDKIITNDDAQRFIDETRQETRHIHHTFESLILSK